MKARTENVSTSDDNESYYVVNSLRSKAGQ